jgi:hypothetical protein
MITLLVVLSVVVIVALIAVLAIYLYWVGVLLSRIAGNLEEANESVAAIAHDGELIIPGIEHINRTGGVVAAALPLLYGFAEQIITKVSSTPERPGFTGPAGGRRRSRMHEAVGFPPTS